MGCIRTWFDVVVVVVVVVVVIVAKRKVEKTLGFWDGDFTPFILNDPASLIFSHFLSLLFSFPFFFSPTFLLSSIVPSQNGRFSSFLTVLQRAEA